ncbi:MAG: hypothetical protein IJD42_05865 [Clostridia bacterium]|nr:hypothetical protein [Clostridia bacterium]
MESKINTSDHKNASLEEQFFDNSSVKEEFLVKKEEQETNFGEGSIEFLQNESKISSKSESEVKNKENFNKNMQNLANFDENISEISNNSKATLDRVSEFSSRFDYKNSSQNIIFSTSNEEKSLFERVFPGVSIEKVQNDPNFMLFAGAVGKSSSFCEIYGNYLTLVKKIVDDYKIRAKVLENNKSASPGALSSPEGINGAFFTKDQVKRMSREQIAKNYSAIRESQQKW